MNLGDIVRVSYLDQGRVKAVRGTVVGKTYEAQPRYDIRFDGGLLRDVRDNQFEPYGIRGTVRQIGEAK